MPREQIVNTSRPLSIFSANQAPPAASTRPGAPAGPRLRKTGVVRRVTNELYDLVDLRTRERYEYRRLPL